MKWEDVWTDRQIEEDTRHPEADSRELTENGQERTKREVEIESGETVKMNEGQIKARSDRKRQIKQQTELKTQESE